MSYALVVAGLPVALFDRLKQESEKRLAPNGTVIATPNAISGSYAFDHADKLLARAMDVALALPEANPFKTLLIYVDFGETSTGEMLQKFFPFALPLALDISSIDVADSSMAKRQAMNAIVRDIVDGSRRLREISRIVSSATEVRNLTPLLLPKRNFRSPDLLELLETLYYGLSTSPSPENLISASVRRFLNRCPRTKEGDDKQHCFSDGQLFFKSPGKHRHGFFRHSKNSGHNPSCLLNARSRIGGTYDYRFHYDCTPNKGALKASYKNCHGSSSPPNVKHVNIAPNDYVI